MSPDPMNPEEMQSETVPETPRTPEPPPLPRVAGYCRACGKPLEEAAIHTAFGTIYCREHVPPAAQGTVDAQASPYTAPPPKPGSDASPAGAFVLGLIPGVGAIYNGQYAKGLVHVVIVGLLISILSDRDLGGFGPLVGLTLAAFWAYMAFEAYHTAKQRRSGQPVDEFSSLFPAGESRFPAAPVLLIALGVIFLLDNLGIVEFDRILRYWPVLLIALGVYMLYLRSTAPKQ